MAKSKNLQISLYPNYSSSAPFNSCIPIIFNKPTDNKYFIDLGIEAKKYYHPLHAQDVLAKEVFDRIICFPLNYDMTYSDLDYIIDKIKEYLNQ